MLVVGLGVTYVVKLVNPSDTQAILSSLATDGATEAVELNILERTVSAISVGDFSDILSKNNILPLVLVSILVGLAISKCGDSVKPLVDVLDSANLIEEQYFLEISSPGIERTIRKDKQLAQNIGKELSIKFFKPYNGKKQMQGTLEKFDEENIYINLENKILDIPKKDIAQIRTVYEWN